MDVAKKHVKIEFDFNLYGINAADLGWIERALKEVVFEIHDIFNPVQRPIVEVTDAETTVH